MVSEIFMASQLLRIYTLAHNRRPHTSGDNLHCTLWALSSMVYLVALGPVRGVETARLVHDMGGFGTVVGVRCSWVTLNHGVGWWLGWCWPG